MILNILIIRVDTVSRLQETGGGLTETLLSHGLTGLMENPTTIMESTAWFSESTMISSSLLQETTSGMILIVMILLTISVRRSALKFINKSS